MTLDGEIMSSGGSGYWALVLVLAALFASASYARTANYRRRVGRNPWGIHPGVWLVIGFFLGIIGMGLAFVACATTRVGPAYGSGGPPPPPYDDRATGGFAATQGWAPPPQAPPAGWYPDPSARHQYRFFTGHDWTDDVVDNGVHSSEALPAPPRRAGRPAPSQRNGSARPLSETPARRPPGRP